MWSCFFRDRSCARWKETGLSLAADSHRAARADYQWPSASRPPCPIPRTRRLVSALFSGVISLFFSLGQWQPFIMVLCAQLPITGQKPGLVIVLGSIYSKSPAWLEPKVCRSWHKRSNRAAIQLWYTPAYSHTSGVFYSRRTRPCNLDSSPRGMKPGVLPSDLYCYYANGRHVNFTDVS